MHKKIISATIAGGLLLAACSTQPLKTANADCDSLGSSWKEYYAEGVNLSFCYDSLWGKPLAETKTPEDDVRQGIIFQVSFPDGVETPIISYSTQDYEALSGADGKFVCYDCIDFSLEDDELSANIAKDLGLKQTEAESIKIKIGGKDAVEVRLNYWYGSPDAPATVDLLAYFIPDSVLDGGYNLAITGPIESVDALEKIVRTIAF